MPIFCEQLNPYLTEWYFFGSLNDANEYISKRRTIAPAVYDARRLREKPTPPLIPAVRQNDENASSLREDIMASTNTHMLATSNISSPVSRNLSAVRIDQPEVHCQGVSSPIGDVSPPMQNLSPLAQSNEHVYDDDEDSLFFDSSTNPPPSQNAHLFRNTPENQLVPLQDATNIARSEPNENVQREFFNACFHWFQHQANTSQFPRGCFNATILDLPTEQQAIAEIPTVQQAIAELSTPQQAITDLQ